MKLLLAALFCFFSMSGFAQAEQAQYSRVKVFFGARSVQDLAALGIEVDHGVIRQGVYLMNDFSVMEIEKIKNAGFEIDIVIEDVRAYYLEKQTAELGFLGGDNCQNNTPKKWKTPEQYTYGSMGGYLTLTELYAVLDTMEARYPHLISVRMPIDTFKTEEERPVYYLKVSNNPNMEEDEPEILYTALHHAREPNSLAQMVFHLWYLLEHYETDSEIKYLVDNVEMFFIPCVNPDGYVFNETNNPNGGGLWRKNRAVENGNTVGVDLNRNYAYKWGEDDTGSSPNPESATYRGSAPASEPETKAVNFLCDEHEFQIALNYHTYGDLLIHPWGYSDQITAEHGTFSALGGMMIKENGFNLGTGTQTVGYTVNGDSDDWMYGEKSIYSMTPEVGSGFWPAESSIDANNKSTIYQNIVAAQLLLNFAEAKMLTKEIQQSGNLEVKVSHQGLLSGSVSVGVTSLTPGFNVETASFDLSMMHLDTIEKLFAYSVENIQGGTTVQVELSTSNELLTKLDTIEFKYWESGSVSFLETGSTIDLWQGWAETNEAYYSPSLSITDSPSGNYAPNEEAVVLSPVIDLTNADGAELTFYAKWEIETGYDFVQVMATLDNGQTFQPLCGLWTKNGNVNQDENQPVYDGLKSDWVKEIIDLQDFLGKEIRIAFRLVSDNYINLDGFYFDDLKVITYFTPTNNEQLVLDFNIKLFPVPVMDELNIQLSQNLADDLGFSIINSLGVVVQTGFLARSTYSKSIPVPNLARGVYTLRLATKQGYLYRKFMK